MLSVITNLYLAIRSDFSAADRFDSADDEAKLCTNRLGKKGKYPLEKLCSSTNHFHSVKTS